MPATASFRISASVSAASAVSVMVTTCIAFPLVFPARMAIPSGVHLPPYQSGKQASEMGSGAPISPVLIAWGLCTSAIQQRREWRAKTSRRSRRQDRRASEVHDLLGKESTKRDSGRSGKCEDDESVNHCISPYSCRYFRR